jgi:hypothetical protein
VIFIEDISLARGTDMLSLINRLTDSRKESGVEDWLNKEAELDRQAELAELEDDEDDEDDEEQTESSGA